MANYTIRFSGIVFLPETRVRYHPHPVFHIDEPGDILRLTVAEFWGAEREPRIILERDVSPFVRDQPMDWRCFSVRPDRTAYLVINTRNGGVRVLMIVA